MKTGTVQWFDREKGFGFIIPDGETRELYVQSANIETEDHCLDSGQRVEFENILGRKGPEAKNVKVI